MQQQQMSPGGMPGLMPLPFAGMQVGSDCFPCWPVTVASSYLPGYLRATDLQVDEATLLSILQVMRAQQ